jgi:hypothetical protein
MAARRLLIVMLVLLGLSTLAAALIPQRTLRNGSETDSTTQAGTTTTTPSPPAGRALTAKIFVGGKKVPVVAGPVCGKRKPRCEPIHVGDRLSLLVFSKEPAQLEFPEFGLFGFASGEAPVRFELLPETAGRFGILFADPGTGAKLLPTCRHGLAGSQRCVAARLEVLTRAAAGKAIAGGAKGPARAESGPA